MKTAHKKIALFLVAIIAIVYSCKKEYNGSNTEVLTQSPDLPAAVYEYDSKHNVDANMATLGRVLFYDRNLSFNNTTSCGSCHKQQFAFANNQQFDQGFDGLRLKRNTPSIQGIVGFRGEFKTDDSGNFSSEKKPTKDNQVPTLLFWDGRQTNLSEMVLNPIVNHKEMNVPSFDILKQKIIKLDYYKDLFSKAYGSDEVSMEKIAFAMESFIQCLNTKNPNLMFTESKPLITEDENLTPIEKHGKDLFHNKYNCASCHDAKSRMRPDLNDMTLQNSGMPNNGLPAEQFAGNEGGGYGSVSSPTFMFNIGLDANYADNGLGALTKNPRDNGIFKVPTLRNISLTAPYMHDGRFATLEQVVDHYSHNIKPHQNVSAQFINGDGSLRTMNISESEKVALVAFLKSIVDKDFITNPMYADPFHNN